ncbi:MAG TPA: D-alanine--D-alanine ligase [Clostridia bacterium]|nr:D-alanine--D-alanine ligase [Clostridia bacterium]
MKLGVIMGGVSSEYEVSLNTGKEIIANLDDKKYDIYPIEIKSKRELIDKAQGLDFAIIALHGKFGEDGTVQGTLDTMGIPYAGSGLTSSALCMNKDLTKKLLRYEGVQTPDWLIVRNADEIEYHKLEQLGYPVVIKPNSGGSSVGTSIVHSPEGIYSAVKEALRFDNEVMLEQYIRGDEITCPILDGKLLPVLSIKPKAEFFSYSSKYDDGGAQENIIELEKCLHRQVEQCAKKSYEVLKCSVYARVDMILRNGAVYVLEVNTLPGMTKNSLFPKSAKAAGISFKKLMELLIEYSLDARKKEVTGS